MEELTNGQLFLLAMGTWLVASAIGWSLKKPLIKLTRFLLTTSPKNQKIAVVVSFTLFVLIVIFSIK